VEVYCVHSIGIQGNAYSQQSIQLLLEANDEAFTNIWMHSWVNTHKQCDGRMDAEDLLCASCRATCQDERKVVQRAKRMGLPLRGGVELPRYRFVRDADTRFKITYENLKPTYNLDAYKQPDAGS
jgi:hypothetical protein